MKAAWTSFVLAGILRAPWFQAPEAAIATAAEARITPQNPEASQIISLSFAALTNLRDDLEEAAVQVEFGAIPNVRANRSLLTVVFQNLIGNAIKFRTDHPPRLLIGATLENREYIVSVADNGRGLDPAPGNGIGLATCKRIIERLGGRIRAEGAPGKGATFYFTLPAA